MRRATIAIAVATAVSSAAWGQSARYPRGIDMVPFKLTPFVNSGLTLDGADTPYSHPWMAQVIVDLNLGVLALKFGPERLGALLPLRADVHITAAYQVHHAIDLAVDLPFTAYQVNAFDALAQRGFPQPSPAAFGLGAPRLLSRFQLLRQSEVPIVSLAAILELRVPLGDKDSFLSDRGFVLAPRLAVERALGPVRLLANVGWRFRTAPGQFMNLYVGHEFTLGGGIIVALPESASATQTALLAEVNAATALEAPFTFAQSDVLKTPLEAMVGARTVLGGHWRLQLSVGKGLGETGYGREGLRVSLAVAYQELPPSDRDGDGIPDAVDGCIDIPEDKDGYQDEDGCPEPNPDDRDGDGIPDAVDQCPDHPGPAELLGCPDRDGDQIPDIADKCPDEPGPPEREGCPPPEDEEPVVLESERLRINNQILFEFGSARLDPRSYKLLDEVAKVLRLHPEVGPVVIEGHTDNIGTRPYNLDLSARRAKAVEGYLTMRGIAATRLRSAGFGYDRPVAPNDTPLNRAKNRRTEFKLVDEKKPSFREPKRPAPSGASRPSL